MTTNELKAWLSGFLDKKTFLAQEDIERIKAKLQETNEPYPTEMGYWPSSSATDTCGLPQFKRA